MSDSHILTIVLGVLLILSEARHFCAERRWFAERERINNRVQAGTLQDYAVHKNLAESKPPALLEPVRVEQSLEDLGSLGADVIIADDAVASAQASYRKEMGE